MPALAHTWDGESPVFVACEHLWRSLDPVQVTHALAAARTTRRAVDDVITGHDWT